MCNKSVNKKNRFCKSAYCSHHELDTVRDKAFCYYAPECGEITSHCYKHKRKQIVYCR